MRAFRTLLAAMIVCLTAPRSSNAASCALLPVTTWYNTIFAGPYQLQFDDHDPAGPHPHRWLADPGMRIDQPDGIICTVSDRVAIVSLPIYIAQNHYLYIDTYSGSADILFVVDARNCKTLWHSPELCGRGFGPKKRGFYLPSVGWLTIRPDCLPGKITDKPYPPLVAPP